MDPASRLNSRSALIGAGGLLGLLLFSRSRGLAWSSKPPAFGERISLNMRNSPFLAAMERANPELFDGTSDCGETCTYTGGTGKFHAVAVGDGKVEVVQKHMVCPVIWRKLLKSTRTTVAVQWPPPHWDALPAQLQRDYTMDGKIAVPFEFHKEDRYAGQDNSISGVWKLDAMEALVHAPDSSGFPHSYGIPTTRDLGEVLRKHSSKTAGKTGLVIGTELPWVELLVVSKQFGGAKQVWTLEYGKLYSEHPDFVTILPGEFAQLQLLTEKSDPIFDFAVTFSSVEHSGLGRYGDPLDAFGDLEAAAQVWCALKEGGHFFLGIPTKPGTAFQDELQYNAHRLYGHNRLAQIFANFRLLEVIPMTQTHTWSINNGEDTVVLMHTVFVLLKLPQHGSSLHR